MQASSLLQTAALEQQAKPKGKKQRSAKLGKDFCLWRKFKEAFRSLYSKGLYKKYAVEHTKHYHDDPKNGFFKDHKGAYGFLAFHRGQIQDLETELMQEAGDCSMGFPFWDWSMDVATFKTSEIWSDEYMGNDEGCVVSGLPADWEYKAGDCSMGFPFWDWS